MTRQMKIAFGLGLAVLLSRPAPAQTAADAGGAEKCIGGAEGSKCGPVVPEHILRVVFDKDTAKGEIKCVKGKLKNGKVVFQKCLHHKLDKYDDIAILKKIIIREKYAALAEKKKTLAKKLAFLDSAEKELKAKLAAISDKENVEYKKTEGALNKIGKEFDKSLADCAKEDSSVFTCPKRD